MPGVLSDSGSTTQAGGAGGRKGGGAEKSSEPGGRAGESGKSNTDINNIPALVRDGSCTTLGTPGSPELPLLDIYTRVTSVEVKFQTSMEGNVAVMLAVTPRRSRSTAPALQRSQCPVTYNTSNFPHAPTGGRVGVMARVRVGKVKVPRRLRWWLPR